MSSSIQINSSTLLTTQSEERSEILCTEPLPPNQEQLRKEGIDFIFDSFPRKLHTFQFIRPAGGAMVRVFTDRHLALEECTSLNMKGYDVYFMVNEGDGKPKSNQRTCRTQDNVINLSACFIDTDACPIERVNEYIANTGLVPHAWVESSPGRYHVYFHITPTEKNEQNLKRWTAIQKILHRLGNPHIENPSVTLGTDNTMHDYAKVLRVPGFVHVKKLFVVRLISSQKETISLDELFALTKAQSMVEAQEISSQHPSPEAQQRLNNFELDDTTIYDVGDRFTALQKLSLSLANRYTFKDALPIFYNFVKKRINNEDGTYLRNNELTPKAFSLLDSACRKINRETDIKITTALKEQDKKDPWHLPDEFFLNAPNGFGDIVAQAMKYSRYPSAPMCFATFITGLSILKSKYFFTPGQSAPALYTLVVAPSGYGKNDPMTLLQNMLVSKGMGSLVTNKIRSDRGLYKHLAASESISLLVLDEVAPMLKAIQDDHAAPHHAAIAEALLEFYSAAARKEVRLGKVSSSGNTKGEDEIILENPALGILGFTVPASFHTLFNADSITKGLYQRFIPIVVEPIFIDESPTFDKQAVIDSPLLDFIAPMVTPMGPDGEPLEVPPLMKLGRTRAFFTPEAGKEFATLSRHYREEFIRLAKDPERSHESGLFSRVAEQIERVATTLSVSTGEIDLTTLRYAQQFIESRFKAMTHTVGDTVLRGERVVKDDLVIKTVVKILNETDSTIVSKRAVYSRMRRHFKSMKDFDQALSEAIELGHLEAIHGYKDGMRPGRSSTMLKLGTVF